MSEKISWKINLEFCKLLNSSKKKILIFAGPSGSGKSFIAKYFLDKFHSLQVVKNFTTRRRREEDGVGHFEYISESQFKKMADENQFFMARTNRSPYYGYHIDDVKKIFENKQVPLFMFRHSGLQCLTEYVTHLYVCFCESDIAQLLTNSQDVEGTVSYEELKKTLEINKDIFAELTKSPDARCCVVVNKYDDKILLNEGLIELISEVVIDA